MCRAGVNRYVPAHLPWTWRVISGNERNNLFYLFIEGFLFPNHLAHFLVKSVFSGTFFTYIGQFPTYDGLFGRRSLAYFSASEDKPDVRQHVSGVCGAMTEVASPSPDGHRAFNTPASKTPAISFEFFPPKTEEME